MKRTLKYGTPQWLLKILHEEFPDSYQKYRGGSIVASRVPEIGYDHPRIFKGKVAIWQPYYAHEQLGKVLSALEKHGVRADINGCSPYFSGRSIAIVMWRPEDAALAHELLDSCWNSAPEKPTSSLKDWV